MWKHARQGEGSNYPMGIAVIGRLYQWLAFPAPAMDECIATGMIPTDCGHGQGLLSSHKFRAFATLVDITSVSWETSVDATQHFERWHVLARNLQWRSSDMLVALLSGIDASMFPCRREQNKP